MESNAPQGRARRTRREQLRSQWWQPWQGGKGCAGGEEHNKWILGLINMGGPRSKGQQDYNWNLFSMTAWVVLRAERNGARPTHQRIRGVGASSLFYSTSRAPAGFRRTRSGQTLACDRHHRGLRRSGKTKPRVRVVGRRTLHWRGPRERQKGG